MLMFLFSGLSFSSFYDTNEHILLAAFFSSIFLFLGGSLERRRRALGIFPAFYLWLMAMRLFF